MKHELIRKIFQDKSNQPPKQKNASIKGKSAQGKTKKEGTGPRAKYLTFANAKLFLLDMNYVSTRREYDELRQIKDYKFLPPNPPYTYREDWQGWNDYLSICRPRNKNGPRPYFEAKAIAQRLSIKYDLNKGDCMANWAKFCDDQYLLPEDEREVPKDVPRFPHAYYDEWEGWPVFLGKKNSTSKLEEAQHKEQIMKEDAENAIAKYNGHPVYAITTGIDPYNTNVIKVVVNYNGLSDLMATCDNLQYNIVSVYLFKKDELPDIIHNLTINGKDNGDSCYTMHNMTALLAGLNFDTEQLPDDLLNKYR